VAEKKRIGITGATGFVGCRLAERLTTGNACIRFG
jgi:nucleoside-diphosphate-sugar epimerase